MSFVGRDTIEQESISCIQHHYFASIVIIQPSGPTCLWHRGGWNGGFTVGANSTFVCDLECFLPHSICTFQQNLENGLVFSHVGVSILLADRCGVSFRQIDWLIKDSFIVFGSTITGIKVDMRQYAKDPLKRNHH